MRTPLLFVTGMPRSGTTLLSTILGRHGRIHALPETHFFDRCYPEGGLNVRVSPDAAARLAQDLEAWLAFGKEHAGPAPPIVQPPLATPRAVFERRLQTLVDEAAQAEAGGKAEGVAWLVEKTPAHHEHALRIAEAYPTARLLTIVRDPRAVSASLQRVPWNHEPPLHHGLRWRRYAKILFDLERRLGERYRWVRYETLLSAPAATVRGLCQWLDVAYEPPMLSATTPASTFDAEAEPWKANAGAALDPGRVEAWRGDLSPTACKLVELGAGRALERLGYESASPTWTPRIAGPVAAQVVAYGAQRLRNKWRYWNEKRTGERLV